MSPTHGAEQRPIWCCRHGRLRFAKKLSLQEPRNWPLLNCSVNVVDYENGGATVVSWGDITHLSTDTDDDSLRKRA